MEPEAYKTTQSFPVFRALGAPPKGPLDRFLSVFADVRAGEGATAVLLAAAAFFLLTSYYVLKPLREALILSQSGAVAKSYSSAAQAGLLLIIVPLYSAFASRVKRNGLLTWLTVFFISNIAIFYLAGKAGLNVGIAFFIWVGIFNFLVVGQLWAFANDVYTESEGKRLFPIVGAGASLGALVGPQIEGRLIGRLGPYPLLVIGGALLAVMIVFIRIVHTRESRKPVGRHREAADKPLGRDGAFRLVFRHRYLLLIALLAVVLNTVNTTGEFFMGSFVEDAAAQAAGTGDQNEDARTKWIGEFYGNFSTLQNLLSTLFQFFLVSRLFHYIGVRGALFILPLLAMGGYGLLIATPFLGLVFNVKLIENSTDYSIQNTARQALFLPTSREAKYKAKAAIDTFFARFGDVASAGLVAVGTRVVALSASGFAAVNLALTFVWLGIVVLVGREYERRTVTAERAAA